MLWTKLQNYSKERFQRYTGIKLPTFNKMVELVKEWESNNKPSKSRPFILPVEDRILMMLCYYREYITYFHIGVKYSISESSVSRNVIHIENILIKSGAFNLTKKSTLKSDTKLEFIVVDASESPIERPKSSKNQKKNYSGKKNDTLKSSNY